MGIWSDDLKDWEKLITSEITATTKSGETSNIKLPVDSKKFLQTMINRLYYNDTNGLKHFRLIHESDGNYLLTLNRVILKTPHFQTQTMNVLFDDYQSAAKNADIINNNMVSNEEKTILAYYARPPTKNIKIFEKVKGALISGKVPGETKNNTPATISLKLKTKFDRTFTYQQTGKVKNGRFNFTVPYPTAPMRGDGYSYDIRPITNYQIKIGSKTTKVFVPEKAVMLGQKINVDFIKNLN
jgi:dolichyl-diphosphooligosaccharide--protein glycosyltransferase